MKAFAIQFPGKRYLASNRMPRPVNPDTGKYPNSGWREFVWTNKVIDAEKFSSVAEATFFAAWALTHDQFEVVELPAAWPSPEPLGLA